MRQKGKTRINLGNIAPAREVSLTGPSNRTKGENQMATTVKDPVCGMDIHPDTAAGTSEYEGQTYYFCSLGCKKSFDKEPEKYIGRSEHEQH
jgi:Cu+-exporting ATPase